MVWKLYLDLVQYWYHFELNCICFFMPLTHFCHEKRYVNIPSKQMTFVFQKLYITHACNSVCTVDIFLSHIFALVPTDLTCMYIWALGSSRGLISSLALLVLAQRRSFSNYIRSFNTERTTNIVIVVTSSITKIVNWLIEKKLIIPQIDTLSSFLFQEIVYIWICIFHLRWQVYIDKRLRPLITSAVFHIEQISHRRLSI